jgi:hypothetical protein
MILLAHSRHGIARIIFVTITGSGANEGRGADLADGSVDSGWNFKASVYNRSAGELAPYSSSRIFRSGLFIQFFDHHRSMDIAVISARCFRHHRRSLCLNDTSFQGHPSPSEKHLLKYATLCNDKRFKMIAFILKQKYKSSCSEHPKIHYSALGLALERWNNSTKIKQGNTSGL